MLASIPAFAGLDDATRERVAARMTARTVQAGDWVFREGDPSDAGLFVVVSGRLEVVAGSAVLRTLGSGTVAGELSLLTGGPRSAGLCAVRDSSLLALPRAEFDALLVERPEFARGLARELGRTLAATRVADPPAASPPCMITVAALRGDADADRWADVLGGRLPGAVLRADGGAPEAWGRALDDLEARHRHVVLALGHTAGEAWRDFCMHQSDRVIVIAVGRPPPGAGALRGADLILASGADRAWLDVVDPGTTYDAGDPSRIARRLSGRALGLVLSGGAARALAHIGVLDELSRAGLTIDRVGGCSMGAFLGALAAGGWDAAQIVEHCRRELAHGRPFGDLTLPRSGLIRGRRAAAMLERTFGDEAIERLPRSFSCVSADLVAAELVVHRRDAIRTAVAASMAVPGIVAPIRDGRRLLVDGGVLDNLPIATMAESPEGPIIASDAMGRRLSADDPELLGARSRPPRIFETLARATTLGSWRAGRAHEQHAAVIIRPALPNIGLAAFDRIDEVVEAGRRATREALDDRAGSLTTPEQNNIQVDMLRG